MSGAIAPDARAPRVVALARDDALHRVDELAAVYGDTFMQPPWNEGESARARFAAQLPEHLTWRSWRGRMALDEHGAPCGMAYGAMPAFPFPATGAYERVERLLGADVAELEGVFEVLEIALVRSRRRAPQSRSTNDRDGSCRRKRGDVTTMQRCASIAIEPLGAARSGRELALAGRRRPSGA
jgi:hypothetical protein